MIYYFRLNLHSVKEDKVVVFSCEEPVDVEDYHLQYREKLSDWNTILKHDYNLEVDGTNVFVEIQDIDAERKYFFRLLVLEKSGNVASFDINDFKLGN